MFRVWVWLIIALAGVGVIAYMFFEGPPGQARGDTGPREARQQAPEDDPVLVQRERLRLAAIGTDAELVEAVPAAGGWTVGLEVTDTAPDESRMFEQAMRVLTELARTGVPIRHATVVFRTDELKDVYGNSLKDVVIGRLRLSGAEFHRINWHGFEPSNFPRLADEWWVHPQVTTTGQQQQTDGSGGQGGSGGGGGGEGGASGGGGGDGGEGGS